MKKKTRVILQDVGTLDPERLLRFVQLRPFEKKWSSFGLTDDDLCALELAILLGPEAPPVMQGTGGLRKVRFAPEGRGKSGAYRICYALFRRYGMVFLVSVFGKSEKDNLTQAEKKEIAKLLREIGKLLEAGAIQ